MYTFFLSLTIFYYVIAVSHRDSFHTCLIYCLLEYMSVIICSVNLLTKVFKTSYKHVWRNTQKAVDKKTIIDVLKNVLWFDLLTFTKR